MSTLSVTAPAGARFDFEPVRTAKGTKDLGNVPILVWESLDSAIQFYGEEGILAICDGTSARVSFQNIARRLRQANKTDDEIASAQIAFRPGKRVVGASTPASRAARSVKAAVDAKPELADEIEKLLAKIQAGDFSEADLKALAG